MTLNNPMGHYGPYVFVNNFSTKSFYTFIHVKRICANFM